jgi:Right handed beta helix region
VATAVASLLLAGIALAAGPMLERSQVAVACENFGLSQRYESIRFAGQAKRKPCSGGKRNHRALTGRIAVERAERNAPLEPPPVAKGAGATEPALAVGPGLPAAGEPAAPGDDPPADSTPPETSISGGPASVTGSTSATFFLVASEAGSTYECELDGGAWGACTSPKFYAGLSTGSHQFSARAKDAAQNVDPSPAARSWTVEDMSEPAPPLDTTPPQTSIVQGPATRTIVTSASFGLSSSEPNSSFTCNLDGEGWEECPPSPAYSELDLGTHEFSARAIDPTGNVDATPAVKSWTIEAPPPPPPPPPTEPAACSTVVTSTTAARSAISNAALGSTICMADGSYGEVSLSASKGSQVTLQAQNPGKANIEGASLSGSHLTLAGFVSTSSIVIQPGATAMTIEHNRITGGGQGIDAGPTTTTTINDTKIIGNQLIGPFGEDAIHLNRYHDSDGDGLGILIEGNEITNVRENGNHSDCLQTVWVGDHIIFRKNYLHDNRCQGFFVKDQASLGGVSGPIHGISVEDNLFLRNKEPCGPPLTSCGQPIYLQVVGPYDGFVMKRNTIWGDGTDSIAAFRENTGADTLIENNVIYRMWTDVDMRPATLRNNTVCMRETSGGFWSTPTGEIIACNLSFPNTAADDYRLAGERGVDWAPAEQHFGP